MRQLTLICVLLAFPLLLAAQPPSSRPSPTPPGAMQLPKGFDFSKRHGIDSTMGIIWKDNGLKLRDDIDQKDDGLNIKFDIGMGAGNRAAIKETDRLWTINQVVNGQPVEIVRGPDGLIVATFRKDLANFWAKVSREQEVAEFLAIVLTYPAAPAAK